jgi:hypothetical protein
MDMGHSSAFAFEVLMLQNLKSSGKHGRYGGFGKGDR